MKRNHLEGLSGGTNRERLRLVSRRGNTKCGLVEGRGFYRRYPTRWALIFKGLRWSHEARSLSGLLPLGSGSAEEILFWPENHGPAASAAG